MTEEPKSFKRRLDDLSELINEDLKGDNLTEDEKKLGKQLVDAIRQRCRPISFKRKW